MRTLPHPDFVALLARADVNQARFARLAGVTARQVNNWCRGRAAVPRWAAILALTLQEITADRLKLALEERDFGRHEALGTPPAAGAPTTRPVMTTLALSDRPDEAGTEPQMIRCNASNEKARTGRDSKAL
ncbi:MAG TPA: hypothetical protein VMU42_03940 [Candidatus Sulfotelmatobacter sp.]|nr:hypothetical protein [Candidatus Sulfotelmatobacter sp.]